MTDEREHGRIVSVATETLGSTLDADAAAGATTLTVFDAADFDPDGGSLSVGGAVLAYSTADDDASTVTLADPLPAAASDGDRVDCWNTLYQAPFTVKTAMVQLDGDDDNPDPIEATVPHFLADKLADGDRGGPGESCVVEYDEDEDEWTITDVRGLADASGAGEKHCNTDTFTVTAAGDQTVPLSHTPLPGSLEVVWHPDALGGVTLTSADWTLDGSTLTVPDPDGLLAINDLIDPLYDYRDLPTAPTIPGAATAVGSTILASVPAQTSIAMPAGTQAGDLLVFVAVAFPLSVSDTRMSLVYSPDGNRGIWVGVADGSGTPLAISSGDDGGFNYDSLVLAAFRGLKYKSATIMPNASTNSLAVPSVTCYNAILAWFDSEGTVSGDPTVPAAYTEVAHASRDTKTHAGVAYWATSGAAMPSPAGSIVSGGSGSTMGGAVLVVS